MILIRKFISFTIFFFIALILLGCSYKGTFSISNNMDFDITVYFKLDNRQYEYFKNNNFSHYFKMCNYRNSKIECKNKSDLINITSLYDKASESYKITIPPHFSLIVIEPWNFFGFINKGSEERLYFLKDIKLLTILTNDGIITYSNKEILKSFKKKNNLWWDIEISALYGE